MRKGDENMEKKKEPLGIQKAWRQLSIQNQIFLSMFLITLLGVGVLMNIVYKTSIDAIEQNYRASYQSTLKNSSRVMDMNLKNIVDVGRNFLNDEALQQILEKGNEYGGSKFTSTDRVKLRVIANEMASQQVWVNYIVFTDLYGHVYQLNNVNRWYVAPKIINTFLESYDLTGKTIIPFATSGGSGIGKTNERLAPSCKGAKLMDGKVFKASVGHKELAAWVDGLKL